MESSSMNDTYCQSEPATHSSVKPSHRLRKWLSDEEYIAAQDKSSSWSHKSPWGEAAAKKFVQFGEALGDNLCHDDTVADFGGNDGYAANCFYLAHKIKPLVVDCEPTRLKYASAVYRLPVLEAFIENMNELANNSIDWGFSSHTLEHMREPERALREMARVVKRACYFVVPLEEKSHGKDNIAHAIFFTKTDEWKNLLIGNGWKVIKADNIGAHEAHLFCEPA